MTGSCMCEIFLPLVEIITSLRPIGSVSRASQKVYLYTLVRFDLRHPIQGVLIFLIMAHIALYY